MQLMGRHYETGAPVRITVEGERITAVEPAAPDGDVSDWPYLAPGLFDLQINGHGGIWFSKQDLTADEVLRVLEAQFRHGITRLCPTLVTASFETLAGGFTAIRAACEQHAWAAQMVPGCHLEGPYISAEDGPRGAHALEHVRPADWSEFQKLQAVSGNRIRLVTLAPESPGAVEFIRNACAAGVTVAIGHTAAGADEIAAAVDAGARLSTHLGNGAHGMIRRHPNYIWEQLGEDRLWASLITDGHHLPKSVVKSMVRAKTPGRVIVTCDAAGLAGCPPGIYREGPMDVEILDDGRIVLAGQRQLLAGSGLATDTCVARVIEMAGLSLREGLDMAGLNPSRLLGFDEIRLQSGSRADLIVFDYKGPGSPLAVRTTVLAGRIAFGGAIAG